MLSFVAVFVCREADEHNWIKISRGGELERIQSEKPPIPSDLKAQCLTKWTDSEIKRALGLLVLLSWHPVSFVVCAAPSREQRKRCEYETSVQDEDQEWALLAAEQVSISAFDESLQKLLDAEQQQLRAILEELTRPLPQPHQIWPLVCSFIIAFLITHFSLCRWKSSQKWRI